MTMAPAINLPQENPAEIAAVFGLLSTIWAHEPNSTVLNAMTQPPMAAAWKELGGDLPAQVTPELVEQLEVDYCQLLVGPVNPVSPVQSIWDQSRFQGDATESMQKYIQMIDGFQPCVEIIDHIAVQLQYAGILFGMADQAKRGLIQGLATAFCADHLEWSSPFFERIQQQSETDFLKSAAKVSHCFLFGNR